MRTCSHPRHLGFSLIELMVALVVAGILAAIAYPVYTSHVQRGRRADAINALTAVMQAQERYRGNNSAYASTLTALNVNVSTIAPLYSITLAGIGTPASFASGYIATAAPVAGGKQASDVTCKTLVVTLQGATPDYSATGDPTNSGTDSDTTAQCWPR
ncbi:type IV pilus assembly protein PilE [Pelomonas saccharophila]|uniref:Type IV pilus assembly protein PilE n=1 Tax=Roseateles saccharophilus TaxID=304 RepID=A0ABU1YF41_ROSSA|nr:type IV pilin protein [Roseateles saccharophilus]MDR7267472.1 type IV pilus assembly protein PilE [Roseateles saccharophilus]